MVKHFFYSDLVLSRVNIYRASLTVLTIQGRSHGGSLVYEKKRLDRSRGC